MITDDNLHEFHSLFKEHKALLAPKSEPARISEVQAYYTACISEQTHTHTQNKTNQPIIEELPLLSHPPLPWFCYIGPHAQRLYKPELQKELLMSRQVLP